MNGFSSSRVVAMLIKEFKQMLRDRPSIIFAMPIVQLLLFGYAINQDPHHLKTAVLVQDHGTFARSVLTAMKNTGYFDILASARTPAELDHLIAIGDVQFAVTIPADFTTRVVRQKNAQILVEADASDPTATWSALAALDSLPMDALSHDLYGAVAPEAAQAPFEVIVHRRYNPENINGYNIVPGLLGTVLSMTLVLLTAQSLAGKRERGIMEGFLATPVTPLEVLIGKLAPYIAVGLVQAAIILVLARMLFDVPMQGGWDALALGLLLFIVGSLLLGFFISSLARTQRQAQLMTQFYMLPSIMLSGFMFPFVGMLRRAQAVGSVIPVTYFLRIVRGALLKGEGIADSWPSLTALFVFVLGVTILAMARYRTTLD